MRLPISDPSDRSTVDYEQMKEMVDCFISRGFTYFDTAHRYNDEASEPALRECLVKRYLREAFTLTNKITMNYINKEEDQMLFIENQLKICGVDFFDNYLLHNVNGISYPKIQKLRTFDFLKEAKARGYARRIGFSFHGHAELLEQVLKEHPEAELVQLQVNYLDWEDEAIQSGACCEVARKYGKPVVVMEPVKGGTLADLPEEAENILKEADPTASSASWAIRFAASQEGVMMVLSGMTTMEQMRDNTSYMTDFQPLSSRETEVLTRAAEKIHERSEIACTSCRYCVTDCPKQILIPDYFNLYNNYHRIVNKGYMSNQSIYYNALAKDHGKASDCIECGQCEDSCPQRLEIRQLLKQVAERFEG